MSAYKKMIQHEFWCPQNEHLMSDVYDSPAWQKYMGEAVYPNNRIGMSLCVGWCVVPIKVLTIMPMSLIGLQLCMDGIPAFSAHTKSLKPLDLSNLSLPPRLRGRPEYMLLMALMPSSLKEGMKKYFDFFADYELNDLFNNGR